MEGDKIVNDNIYNKIDNIIKNELIEMINNDSVYNDYNIQVSNEQQFIRDKNIDPRVIYIVIQHEIAEVNYGQTIMPVTITSLSEQNKLDICQQLLYDFAVKYNMAFNDDKTVFQLYETPSVAANFQPFFEGFRSILQVSGSVILSENANFYGLTYYHDNITNLQNSDWEMNLVMDKMDLLQENKYYNVKMYIANYIDEVLYIKRVGESLYVTDDNRDSSRDRVIYQNGLWIKDAYRDVSFGEEGEDLTNPELIEFFKKNGKYTYFEDTSQIKEEVDFITSSLKCDFVPDTQAMYFRNNFTQSINKFGNLGFSVTLFTTTDSNLVDDILYVITKKSDVNKTFKFGINFLKKHSLTDDFKVISISADQQIGDMTLIVLTFIN